MRLPRLSVPIFIAGAIVMMVVPLPAMLLDLLLTLNLSIAVLVLLGTIFLRDSLEFSSFPSLLLVTTLTRLALNVSSTRLILLDGYAGKVIESFGNFVVGGSIVVGLVVFLILIVIQFAVITNGAGRVAEVAARFTLDAMPGRQMAIDADLSAGLLDQDQARTARLRIAREADFYGAMDGASKFVKGDAIAGIVIVLINLIGGFAIGVGVHGMDFAGAMSTYALLAVGDGLVSQVPALLISIGTGLLVTRVGSEDDLAGSLGTQLFTRRESVRTAGFFVGALGLLPGLPKLPFLVVAAVLVLVSARPEPAAPADVEEAPVLHADPDDPEALMGEMRMERLELHLSYDILDLIDAGAGGDLLTRVKALRRQIAQELGLVIPPVRTRDDAMLPEAAYTIMLSGVEVGGGVAPRGKALALPLDGGDALRGLGGTPTTEPVFGLPAFWIPEEARADAAALGATVVDRASAIVTHLAEVARTNAGAILSRQDVQSLVESLRADEPLLAAEIGSELLPLGLLHAVLRGLLDEQVSIRDLARIVEAVSARARETRAVEHLVAAARVPLGAAICARIAPDGRLGVLTIDPALEASLHESLREIDGALHLVADASRIGGLREAVERHAATSTDPVAVVCAQMLRRPLQRALAGAGVDVPVLAYPELPSHLTLETKGVVGHARSAVA